VPRYAALESLVRYSRTEFASETEHPTPTSLPTTIGRYNVVDRLNMHELGARVNITARADLHGMGELLYYLIAGRPICPPNLELPALVYRKSSPARLRDVEPSVLASTDRLVAELTAPDPAQRPASAIAVRDRVDRILANLRSP
jgi:hypothetical protein